MADRVAGGNQTAVAGIRAALHLLLQEQGQGQGQAELQGSLARLVGAIPAGVAPEVAAAAARVRSATAGESLAAAAGLLRALDEFLIGDSVTLLVIDDDPASRLHLCRLLQAPGRIVLEAPDAATAQQQLAAHPVRLILLDLVLGDVDGRNLLARFKEDPATAAIPVIVMSGQTCAAVKAECTALGAAGYFEKPFNPETLVAVACAQLARGAVLAAAPLQDELTGVGNRAALAGAFAALPAPPASPPPCLAMIDLDDLADCNTARGAEMGDAALRRVAALLRDTNPSPACVSRWQGGTFACLYAGVPLPDVAAALEKVRTALAGDLAAREPAITFSAGLVPVLAGELAETLAAAARHLEQAKGQGRNCIIGPGAASCGRRHRVLLAEDDDLIAALVKHFLAREDIDCDRVGDGQAALDAMTRGGYDLLLLDGRMPVLDGVQVLQRLRALPAPAVPVIMLTGLSAEADISRALELGASDYLTKPFSPTELVARVRRLLRRR